MNVNILFSTLENKTWIQLERFSVFYQPFCHCATWIYYKLSGRQTGPAGTSEFNETCPLEIDNEKWKLIKNKILLD